MPNIKDGLRNYNTTVIESSSLILGDQKEIIPILPRDSFDLIYLDPPYELDYISNIPGDKCWSRGKSSSRFTKAIPGDTEGEIDWSLLAKNLFPLLKRDRFLFCHSSIPLMIKLIPAFRSAGFTYKGTIAWNKHFAIGGDIKSSMKRDWEPILYFAKGRPKFYPVQVLRKNQLQFRDRISEIQDWHFSMTTEDKCGHPTGKPLELGKQIIKLTTQERDNVLDCFAGAGTSALACKRLNREFTGIEIDENFYNIGINRLKKDQTPLFE